MTHSNFLKKFLFASLFVLSMLQNKAQQLPEYQSLDKSNPISFRGNHIIYNEETIVLGPSTFFIDGQLTDKQANAFPFVYNSINEAAANLIDGTEESPMVLHIAPYVYWIDDPDDPAIRVAEKGSSPFGLIITCEWLRFYGLSEKAENVVLACNRGQTIGSKGNFTMFRINGQGTSSENITFGNYCNVDLEYPLKPSLNRGKRASAIVQAQLILCDGDKIVARNTHFISRLNLCPFVGGKRVLFDNCHFESTDDALCGSGVYLNSTLEFYSSKPFYGTRGTGAVFLNCDIKSFAHGKQYFTKANGQIAVVDTRFSIDEDAYIGWRDIPPIQMRNYQYNVSKNGKPLFINKNDPSSTVSMEGKNVLNAYRFEIDKKVFYNTYNLLRGDDNWDPMQQREFVKSAEKELEKDLNMLPVQIKITSTKRTIETGKDQSELSATVFRFGNYKLSDFPVEWAINPEYDSLVQLKVGTDRTSCVVIPTSTFDETKQVIVTASTPSGLQAAAVLTVSPQMLEAPKFSSFPRIIPTKNGTLTVKYHLDMPFDDESLVTWYRCQDDKGNHPIPIAVSRFNEPLLEYKLMPGDIDYFIKVSVAPKHLRCLAGDPVETITTHPIKAKEIKTDSRILYTDFKNVSTQNQAEVLPGFWTFRHFDPTESNNERDAWYYGEGRNGAAGHIGLSQGRTASLSYTPMKESYSDMKVSLLVAPFKSAGQGFSIADLYMDVLIKLDPTSMTGFGIRFIRTTKYGDAVDCILVKYDKGTITEISEAISTSCYRTPIRITLELKGKRLIGHAETIAENYQPKERPDVESAVNIETNIEINSFGGFGIQYVGGASAIIKEVEIEWE